MSTVLQHIPGTEGVRKIEAFAVCEQTLAPGESVPLHSHASALHQAFVDAVAAVEKATSLASLPEPEAMQRVARIGAQHQMYFAPQDVSSPAVGRRA